MTSSPSFERIDYQLRYNKHIERKMIFDLLSRAHQHVGLANHRYL
ncbi:O-methyltransferase, partial [Ralstonia pseudosolanacearum]